eukprot:7299847-Lingulodinium_polyedra.AAC.1
MAARASATLQLAFARGFALGFGAGMPPRLPKSAPRRCWMYFSCSLVPFFWKSMWRSTTAPARTPTT